MTEPASLISQLSGRPRKTGKVSFAFDPNAYAEWHAKDFEAKRLEASAIRAVGDAVKSEKAKANSARKAADKMRDALVMVTFHYGSIDALALEKLRNETPPTEEQEAEWEDGRKEIRIANTKLKPGETFLPDPGPLATNIDLFKPALTAACVTKVELPDGTEWPSITVEELGAMKASGWNQMEFDVLYNAISAAHGVEASLGALGKG